MGGAERGTSPRRPPLGRSRPARPASRAIPPGDGPHQVSAVSEPLQPTPRDAALASPIRWSVRSRRCGARFDGVLAVGAVGRGALRGPATPVRRRRPGRVWSLRSQPKRRSSARERQRKPRNQHRGNGAKGQRERATLLRALTRKREARREEGRERRGGGGGEGRGRRGEEERGEGWEEQEKEPRMTDH